MSGEPDMDRKRGTFRDIETAALQGAGHEADLDLVGDLQRAEERRIGLDPPVGLAQHGMSAECSEQRFASKPRLRTAFFKAVSASLMSFCP